MINYEEVINKFESTYKHLGSNAEHYILEDIDFWERANMIDYLTANILISINKAIATNGGKLR